MIQRVILGAAAALFMVLGTGCAKQAFQAVETKPDQQAVYVYWPEEGAETETTYEVLVNGEAAGTLHKGCYIPLQVPQGPVALTVRNSEPLRAAVEKKVLQLDAVGGTARYVKVTFPFEVAETDAATGPEAIKDTFLWEDQKISFKMPETKEETPAASPSEEIERLYNLKEKGAITH